LASGSERKAEKKLHRFDVLRGIDAIQPGPRRIAALARAVFDFLPVTLIVVALSGCVIQTQAHYFFHAGVGKFGAPAVPNPK
jgi:hypothetical protein